MPLRMQGEEGEDGMLERLFVDLLRWVDFQDQSLPPSLRLLVVHERVLPKFIPLPCLFRFPTHVASS